ncbi:hypothetical protein ABW19_dt0208334 [Dactylella cylindrospora]|nr:hypothetical protein ABW19_dt0208334 [Dactylella cylindrospora]
MTTIFKLTSPQQHPGSQHSFISDSLETPARTLTMALPPHTIRIKRRRNEDPVQTLLVESKRRRVDGEFCFILHDTVESSASSVASAPVFPPNFSEQGGQGGQKPQPGIPIISTTATNDGFQPGSFNEATSSDREGRPIAADRRLPIASREIKKAVSPARSARLKKKPTPVGSRHRLSESVSTPLDMSALSPTTKAEVRRYHLSKKVRIENGGFGQVPSKKRERGLVPIFMEGAGRVAKKRSALKIGKGETGSDSDGEDLDDESLSSDGVLKLKTTKKPKTHFKERELLQRQRSRDASRARQSAETGKPEADSGKGKEEIDFAFESDELARQLQDMVLDYIANQPDLQNYPPTTKSPTREKPSKAMQALGGGVGGGTWTDVEKSMDVDLKNTGDAMKVDSDGEDGEWVYDVYFREELKKSQDGSSAVTTGDYGVLVISNSDDEQWWYENEEEEESASDIWGSEDEDSNAEEYYKNDYPDEDDYDDSDDEFYGSKRQTRPRVPSQRKRGVWDYNSDGSYDLEREDASD